MAGPNALTFKDWTYPTRIWDPAFRHRARDLFAKIPQAAELLAASHRIVAARFLNFLPFAIAEKNDLLVRRGMLQAPDRQLPPGSSYLYDDLELATYCPSALARL